MDGCGCLFLALGLGLHGGNFDDAKFYGAPLANPLGRMEIGYETKNNFTIKLEHTSQVLVKDFGLNVLMIQKRWNIPRD